MSFNREERISPVIRMTGIRNQVRGAIIFRERTITIPESAPAPTEWSDIFHQKFIMVTAIARIAVDKIYAFKKTGT